MVDFRSARALPLGILCLIALLSISIHVEVSSETTTTSQQATTSQQKITGSRDKSNTVRSLVIKGNNSFSEQRIRALMRTDVWSVYDETVLASDFDAIINFYMENGYRLCAGKQRTYLCEEIR